MDIGTISARYAKALYRFACENKEDEQVYAEMQCLDENFRRLSALSSALLSPVLSGEQRESLILSAANCPNTNVSASTQRFVRLVVKQKRADIMHFIATSYIAIYEKSKKIITGNLTVAYPISEATALRVQQIVKARTGGHNVRFKVSIDPSIGGGFILQYGDNRMDASLTGQLNRLRCELK